MRDRPERFGVRRNAWLTLFALAVFALVVFVFCVLPSLWVTEQDVPEAADRLKARTDIRTAGLQVLGGLVILFGAYLTWQNVLTNREAQITERFTRAIDQLGNKARDVRVGAIYGLGRIARESQKDHGPIMEVLTAYVREHAPWPPKPPKPPKSKTPDEEAAAAGSKPLSGDEDENRRGRPAADVQAALTVIGGRKLAHDETNDKGERKPLDLRRTDLRGADLPEAQLERADFTGAHFEEGYNLEGAYLEGAYLKKANLKEADFQYAHLGGAELWEAQLEGAKLLEAYLEGAKYDSKTTWPDDFDYVAGGALLASEAEADTSHAPTRG